jgi:PhoPQ-activated pathogenicity-related protein
MTSQRWLTDAEFAPDSESSSIWWHWLVIIVPEDIRFKSNATLYITGDRNKQGNLPDYDGEDIILSAGIAVSTGTIVGVLFQVSYHFLLIFLLSNSA